MLPCSLVKTWQYLIESAPSILLIRKLETAGLSETLVRTYLSIYLPGNTGSQNSETVNWFKMEMLSNGPQDSNCVLL